MRRRRPPGRLPEPVDELAHRQAVDQPADREGADEQADQREIQAEAQMQVGADIGEGAEHGAEFHEGHDDHLARPWRAQHGRVVGNKVPSVLRRRRGAARDRIARELVEQPDAGEPQHGGENEEHGAPAEIIAEHAAGGLPEQLAEDLTGEEAAEHLLAALIGDDVADKGHGEGNDPAGG